MVSRPLHRLPVVRDSPAVRAYGSLFALLFASLLLEFLLVRGVDTVSMLVPDVFDPKIAGAVVYAALGMVGIATAYGIRAARRPPSERLERHDVVQLGGVTAMLLLVASYLLHSATDLPLFPGNAFTAVLRGGLAMVILAFVYARACEFDICLDLPDRETVPLAGVAISLAAIAGVGQFAISMAAGDPRLSPDFLGEFGPRLSVGMLAWRVVVPGVCVGVGMGFLYNGAVQERLRERLDPAGATAAVTVLVGLLGWAFVAGGLTNSAVTVVGALAAVVLLSLLGAAIAARGVRLVARRLDVEATPVVGAAFGVAVVAVPFAGMAVIEPSAARVAGAGLAATVVAAVACVAYERSRSVWIPALAFVSYLIAGHTDLLLAIAGFVA